MSGPLGYDGWCPICGWVGRFTLEGPAERAPRDFRCSGCRATVVFQDEAAAILDEFEQGRMLTLDALITEPDFAELGVLHIGRTGPVRNRLKLLRDYQETVFDPEVPLGQTMAEQPQLSNQDHQRLTFEDGRFEPRGQQSRARARTGLASGSRGGVPRSPTPGAVTSFSIPGRQRAPLSTERAAVVNGEIVHRHEARYHNSPEGELPALVSADFGSRPRGCDAGDRIPSSALRRPHRVIQAAAVNFVVVGARPHGN